jgi:outer membrane receptor protein involved in Fe transport
LPPKFFDQAIEKLSRSIEADAVERTRRDERSFKSPTAYTQIDDAWVVDFTGGLFYFKEGTNQTITGTAAALSFLAGIGLVERYRLETTSVAAYGQTTSRFTDRWALIFGGRNTNDDKTLSGAKEASPLATTTTPFLADEDSNKFTGRLGVEWQSTDDILAYATVSQRYKIGTDDAGANALAIVNVLGDAENDTLEVGVKAEYFGSLSLDTTAFMQPDLGQRRRAAEQCRRGAHRWPRGRGDLRSQSEFYDTAMRCPITPRTAALRHTYRF